MNSMALGVYLPKSKRWMQIAKIFEKPKAPKLKHQGLISNKNLETAQNIRKITQDRQKNNFT